MVTITRKQTDWFIGWFYCFQKRNKAFLFTMLLKAMTPFASHCRPPGNAPNPTTQPLLCADAVTDLHLTVIEQGPDFTVH